MVTIPKEGDRRGAYTSTSYDKNGRLAGNITEVGRRTVPDCTVGNGIGYVYVLAIEDADGLSHGNLRIVCRRHIVLGGFVPLIHGHV